VKVSVLTMSLFAAAMPWLTACHEQQEAVAADMPKLEVKATVAKPVTASITAPIDGRVQSLAVREGALVRTGDVLLTLVNPAVDRDLAYAHAQLAVAEYRLRHAGSTPHAVDGPLQEILRNRKAKLARYEALFRTHDVSLDELENAQNELAAAMRDVAASNAAPPSDPALLQLDAQKAQAEEALADDRKKLLTVAAPVGGVITRIVTSEGEGVFPRDPLLEIANAATLEVRGAIAPELLRYVHPGMAVEIKVFTVPPRRFSETIRNILPATDDAGATLVVSVPNPDGALQPGTPALITVR
jgi:multidrug resistance efflux pump